ncbi:PREDICTED: cytokinin dehydrogenase 3 isoform X2 [Nelumbo nucifera]|uniref:cytokinin dehydrogenase n=1 Tax=Nelumbo nucifera TaxID=4432 RepID=A0A1U7YQ95_NELNU|nr:PREDICTED: cytokinin dehydrogenase 3 isoform X2 [Nelumbo nucifera]
MGKTTPLPLSIVLLLFISCLMSIIGKLRPWTSLLPPELLSLDLATRLHIDPEITSLASTDFGKLVRVIPAAVLYPLSLDDIVALIRFSFRSSVPFGIAARGRGHSVRGQATAHKGVVVDMRSLDNDHNNGSRIIVDRSSPSVNNWYADVGCEQLWVDVLHATLEHGLAPRSWTDYLYLTVGGTLSNAGISGQSFRHGPQISNVYEMDVVTGRGELVTCSPQTNSELFYAVLGGLGQFGIITRARIALEPAPTKVRWVRLLYHDFIAFTRDQEHLISFNNGSEGIKGLDYVEGSLVMNQSPANNWRSSFFSPDDHSRIISLANEHGILYSLEVAKYYDDEVDGELEALLKGLSFIPDLIFAKDVSYIDFLNRVRSGELELQSQGLWDVPHPWLNLFVPKSRILDFDSGAFKGILRQNNKISGPILVYPMNRNKMSAVIPEEDIFYSIGLLLQSSGTHDWEHLEEQNTEILRFCEKAGIKIKQYLPRYQTKAEWVNHFGPKWDTFKQRKTKFDPKAILSPGQGVFTS